VTERFSLDTNVLVYAFDASAEDRHRRALTILDVAARRPCILTVQALAEFHSVVTRKGMLARREAAAQARDWSTEYEVVGADGDALGKALSAADDERFSVWDALMLATLEQAGCTLLLSEDVGDGAKFGKLTVVNPFKGAAIPKRAAEALGLR